MASGDNYEDKITWQVSFYSRTPRNEKLIMLRDMMRKKGLQLYWIDQLSESTGEWIKTSAYNLTWSQFKTSTETPEYLASAYLKNFERAGVEEEEARRQYARSWYDFLESGVEPAGRYIVRFIPA